MLPHLRLQIEDISNLLNTGEVPNLFDTSDTIAIGEAVRTRARAARMDGTRADLFAYFVQQVCICVCVRWSICLLLWGMLVHGLSKIMDLGVPTRLINLIYCIGARLLCSHLVCVCVCVCVCAPCSCSSLVL